MNNGESNKLLRPRTFHLFAGAGGGILADILLDHRVVGAVEGSQYRRRVLRKRQEEDHLPRFPVFKKVEDFDGVPWRGLVEIVCGGFPCQDVSEAGRGLGVRSGTRSGLWSEFARIVGEIQPSFVFIENTPLLVSRGLDVVLTDLARLGYDARWCMLGARHLGYSHKRKRIWILAYPKQDGRDRLRIHVQPGSLAGKERQGICEIGAGSTITFTSRSKQRKISLQQRPTKSGLARVANGVADQLDRIAAIGDGQVPQVAAAAFLILSEGLI